MLGKAMMCFGDLGTVQDVITATQNNVQFKTPELYISGTFHLTFSNCGGLWLTHCRKEMAGKGVLPCYSLALESRNSCLKGRGQETTGVAHPYKTPCKRAAERKGPLSFIKLRG